MLMMILFLRPLWTTLILWLLMVTPAQARLLLRIAVEQSNPEVKVGSSTSAVIRSPNGQTLGSLSPQGGFVAKVTEGQVVLNQWKGRQLWIEPSNGGYVWIGDGWYRGKALLIPEDEGVTVVNYVDLEQYLYSVLGAEMDGSWPQEALKAQAVAARTYALYKRERSSGVYDLGDDQLWQVYRGVSTESSGTQAAVSATQGQVLTHNGQVILAAFHSSSGGHTENSEDVWYDSKPYLRGVPDYDQNSPVFEWTKTFSQTELTQQISGVGTVEAMTPQQTSAYGSILSMKVTGSEGSRVMSGDDLARILGLKSTRFRVNRSNGSTNFVVTGRGFGHAVGLSQWGAYYLANAGYTYHQILLYYYQNSILAKIEVR